MSVSSFCRRQVPQTIEPDKLLTENIMAGLFRIDNPTTAQDIRAGRWGFPVPGPGETATWPDVPWWNVSRLL